MQPVCSGGFDRDRLLAQSAEIGGSRLGAMKAGLGIMWASNVRPRLSTSERAEKASSRTSRTKSEKAVHAAAIRP